jgi:hypothetical protein
MRYLVMATLLGAVIYVTDHGLVTANKSALYNGNDNHSTVMRFKKENRQTNEKPGITGPLRMMLRGAGYNH